MMTVQQIIAEAEFKRARENVSFNRLAKSLGVTKEQYLGWVDDLMFPNSEQLKMLRLWILDQLQLVSKEEAKEN